MTFLTKHWRGLSLIALGLITVLGAHFFLDSCGEAGKFITTSAGAQVDMRCSWTERAVEGVGALVVLLGLLMLILPAAVQGLSLAAAGAGLLILATPLWLIPTCANPMMPCNMALKPGTVIFGALVALAGILAAIRLRRISGASTRAA